MYFSLLFILAVLNGTQATPDCRKTSGALICNNLTNADLPVQGFEGHYNYFVLTSNAFTHIKSNSFPGIIGDNLVINSNPNLETIDADFLEAPELVLNSWECNGNSKLK